MLQRQWKMLLISDPTFNIHVRTEIQQSYKICFCFFFPPNSTSDHFTKLPASYMNCGYHVNCYTILSKSSWIWTCCFRSRCVSCTQKTSEELLKIKTLPSFPKLYQCMEIAIVTFSVLESILILKKIAK